MSLLIISWGRVVPRGRPFSTTRRMTGFVHVQVRFNTQFFPMTLVVGAETVPPLLMTDPSSREGSHFAPSHRAVHGGGGTLSLGLADSRCTISPPSCG